MPIPRINQITEGQNCYLNRIDPANKTISTSMFLEDSRLHQHYFIYILHYSRLCLDG